MKMIYKSLLIVASLSPTLAAGMRRAQESSLGDLFLAAAENTNTTMFDYQRETYISAEVNFQDGTVREWRTLPRPTY